MTFKFSGKKPTLAAVAAIATLTAGMTIADTASAQNWRGGRGGGTSWSFSIGQGPAYGYGGYYGGRGWNGAPRVWGYSQPYYGGYYGGRSYYAPRGYYRGRARYRGCDRWMWDGWRQTYVLVRGRC